MLQVIHASSVLYSPSNKHYKRQTNKVKSVHIYHPTESCEAFHYGPERNSVAFPCSKLNHFKQLDPIRRIFAPAVSKLSIMASYWMLGFNFIIQSVSLCNDPQFSCIHFQLLGGSTIFYRLFTNIFLWLPIADSISSIIITIWLTVLVPETF